MSENNLGLIYDEIVELHKQQQDGVNLLYNKLNWILVSDVVFLSSLYGARYTNTTVLLLVSVSAAIALGGFKKETFNFTAKISSLLADTEYKDFLRALITAKLSAFNKNLSKIKRISDIALWSQSLLMTAILLQFVLLVMNKV